MTSKGFSTTRRQALLMGAAAGLLPAIPGLARAEAVSAIVNGRGQSFDAGWRFFKGVGSFEGAGVDDMAWRALDLPHDWSIEDIQNPTGKQLGPFDPAAIGASATGYTVGGEGWYRKQFVIGSSLKGSHVEVVFDGVFEVADVWLNGQHVTSHFHGYTAFACDLTPYLVAGKNTLAVRVRNIGKTSRWYSGSGIYRSVTLNVVSQKARIAPWGVSATTHRLSDAGAQVEISTQLSDIEPGLVLVTSLRDAQGKLVAQTQTAAEAKIAQSLTVKAPALWSPKTPHLYVIETELRKDKRTLDRMTTPFGIRIVTFDVDNGMQINGEAVKLRGGCVHGDNGPLGTVSLPDAEDRRMKIMKARGYNAIRCSHNPPSQAFVDAADRNGVLLIVEAFDCWLVGKNPQDYSVYFQENWRSDLAAMVLAHRNHPSVIMWSIGNEIPHRSNFAGMEVQWNLANALRTMDPSRPVTAAVNGFNGHEIIADDATARPGFAGVPDQNACAFLDVVGYNYKLSHYEGDHAKYPKRIMVGSESFPKEMYDIWALTEARPYLLGDFVWTAMDYLGEAGCGNTTFVKVGANSMVGSFGSFPWINAYCGDIDLIGGAKAPSRYRDVIWGVSQLEMAVERPAPEGMMQAWSDWGWADELPSWTWPGSEAKPLKVKLYSNAERIEVTLNGKSIFAKDLTAADKMRASIDVPYAPGTLQAIAYKGGKEVSRKTFTTTGQPAGIRLAPESRTGKAGRNGLSYVAVEVVDAKGLPVPDATNGVTLSLTGPIELLGFTSGNPRAQGSFQSLTSKTFHGRALAVLRSKGKAGMVTITAHAEGLAGGSAQIRLA